MMRIKRLSKKIVLQMLTFIVLLAISLSIITIQPNGVHAALAGAESGFLYEDFESIEAGTLPKFQPTTDVKRPAEDSDIHFWAGEDNTQLSANTTVCSNPLGEGKVVRLEGRYDQSNTDQSQALFSKTLPIEDKGQVTNYVIAMDVYLPTNVKGLSEYFIVQFTAGSADTNVMRPFKIAGGETGTIGETGKTYIMPFAWVGSAGTGFDPVEVPIGKWFKIVYELDTNTKYGKSDLYISYLDNDQYVTQTVFSLSAGDQPAGTPELWNTAIHYVDVHTAFAATTTGDTMTQFYVDNLYVSQNPKTVAFGPDVFNVKVDGEVVPEGQVSVEYKYQSQYADASTFQWYGAVDTGDTSTLEFVAIDGATNATYSIAKDINYDFLKCVISPKDSQNRTSEDVETEILKIVKPVVKESFVVKFDANGKDSATGIPADMYIDDQEKISEPVAPELEGHVFGGWYTDANCETAWDFENGLVGRDITLYAKWTANIYDVTFISTMHGGEIDAKEIAYGNQVAAPTLSEKIGYEFDGWYTEAEFTNKWDFEDGVTSNLTLYAKVVPQQLEENFGNTLGYLYENFEDFEIGTLPKFTPTTEVRNPAEDSEMHFWFNANNTNISAYTAVCNSPSGEGKVVLLEGVDGKEVDDQQSFFSKLIPGADQAKTGKYTVSMDVYLPTNMKGLSEYFMFNFNSISGAASRQVKIAGGETGIVGETGKTYIMPFAWAGSVGTGFDAVEVPIAKWFKIVYEIDCDKKYGQTNLYVSYWGDSEYVVKTVFTNLAGDNSNGIPEIWNTGMKDLCVYSRFIEDGVAKTKVYVDNVYLRYSNDFAPDVCDVMVDGVAKQGQTLTGSYMFIGKNEDKSTVMWYKAQAQDGVDVSELNFSLIEGANERTYAIKEEDEGCYIFFVVKPKDSTGLTSIATKSSAILVDSSYNVKFDANAEDVSGMPENVKLKVGQKVVAPTEKPVRGGYVFVGWYKEATCENAWDFANDVIDGETTIYAKWERLSFVVKFDANGKDSATGIPADMYIDDQEKISEPVAPELEGHVFGGWYTDANCETAWDFENGLVGRDITLYAKWTANIYDVTFISTMHGGEIDAKEIAYGTQVAAPTLSEKIGYEFDGWYTEAEFTNKWDFEDGVTSNLTLYAKVVPQQLEENFGNTPGYIFEDFEDIDLGSLPLHTPATEGAELPANSDRHIVFPVVSSIKRDYTAVCENPLGEGKVVLLEGNSGGTDDKQYFYSKLMPGADQAKTGKYTVSMDVYLPTNMKGLSEFFIITLNTAGATTAAVRPFKIAGGETGTVGETGKTYIMPFNWLGSAGTGFDAVEVPIAKWFKIVYEIDCTVKYGQSNLSISYLEGEQYVTKTVFSLTAGNQPDGTPEIWNSGLKTLYTYTTFVEPDAGEAKTKFYVDNIYVRHGDDFAPDVCNVMVDGVAKQGQTLTGSYVFIGKNEDKSTVMWYKAQAQDGVDVSELNFSLIEGANERTYAIKEEDEGCYIFFVVKPKDSTGLTSVATKSSAILVDSSCKVDFDSNAGNDDVTNMPESIVKNLEDKLDAITSIPVREGYVFAGWYKEATCENAWDFENDTLSNNITLYAKWDKASYSVTFDANGKDGVKGMPSGMIVNWQNAILKPESPELEGYIFGGWYKEATCETQWDFTNDMVGGNVTLYAKWIAKEYTVLFISTMTDDEFTPIYVKHNEKITAPSVSSVDGYTFDGWYTESEFTNKWDFEDGVTSSMNLYAKFVEINQEKPGENDNQKPGEGETDKESGCGSIVETRAANITISAVFAAFVAIVFIRRKDNN